MFLKAEWIRGTKILQPVIFHSWVLRNVENLVWGEILYVPLSCELFLYAVTYMSGNGAKTLILWCI